MLAVLLALLLPHGKAEAQRIDIVEVQMDSTVLKLSKMTLEDYAAIELPPLEVLYNNAWAMSNAVKYYKYEAAYYRSDIKTERRRPLEWVRLFANYSYGNSDMSAISLMQTTYQVWSTAATSQSNSYYNVGVALNIPLYNVINTRNKVKQARDKVEEMEYRSQAELDAIKEDIIECYCSIVQNLNMLKVESERLVIAQAQYNVAESDFVNNKIDAEALYRSKSFEEASINEYERVKKQLNHEILRLEVLSCTPIVSNLKMSMED